MRGPLALTQKAGTSCHAIPGYQLLFPHPSSDRDCVACHLPEYQREHAGSGFPQTCATCHMSGLEGSAMTHDVTQRLSWFLFDPVSSRRPGYLQGQAAKKALCR